jgi:hypothetical protein
MTFVVITIVASLLLGGTFLVPGRSASGMQESGRDDVPVSGTPVAAATEPRDPLDGEPSSGASVAGDPLDGDPLDGPPADGDPGAPVDQTQLEIVRSARPHDAPATVAAYDDDPRTVWMPQADVGETWLWLDLGLELRLREVRWLAEGGGTVEIAVSSDRQRWRDIDRVDARGAWQGVELRDDARYVRLTLLATDDGGELPAIAEAAVYGPDTRQRASAEQQAGEGREQKRDRQSHGDRPTDSEQPAAGDDSSGGNEGRRQSRSSVRVGNPVESGKSRCRGERERCEARQGQVAVEDDCEREGTCTIDVRADGGLAVCDAAGGDESDAGDGEGRRAGSGGRCDAVADGGAVAIGDVNP